MDDLIPQVQSSLGSLFKKPKCSEKLLNKPPFRFLHDVVMATASAVDTGFAQGLYTDSESDSSQISDKAGKVSFLDKILLLVGVCEGEEMDVRAAKVVAGLEAESTARFLVVMARVAGDEVSPNRRREFRRR